MPTKQIGNPLQAWTAGATWGNAAYENSLTVEQANLLNGTGLTLYQGDIVCLDVTGTQAILSTAAGDVTTIGVVGGYTALDAQSGTTPTIAPGTAVGGFYPPELSASRIDSVTTTSTSTTVTDASCVASDLGKSVIGTGIPNGATIVSVTAGTSFVISAAATASGTVNAVIANAPTSIGPGWGPSSIYPVGVQVPVILSGYGRVNINGYTGLAAKGLIAVSSGSVVGAAGSATAVAGNIAISLEAYAARDVSLTTAGISGHDTVRAIIGKF